MQGGVKHTVAVPVSVPAGMHWQSVREATEVGPANDVRNAKSEEHADQVDRDDHAAKKKLPAAADRGGEVDTRRRRRSPGEARSPPRRQGRRRRRRRRIAAVSAARGAHEEDNGDDASSKSPAAPEPVSALTPVFATESDEVSVLGRSEVAGVPRVRWSIAAGAGVSVLRGNADEVTALSGRVEAGACARVRRTRARCGWSMASTSKATCSASLAYRGFGPVWFGAGLGLHVGAGDRPGRAICRYACAPPLRRLRGVPALRRRPAVPRRHARRPERRHRSASSSASSVECRPCVTSGSSSSTTAPGCAAGSARTTRRPCSSTSRTRSRSCSSHEVAVTGASRTDAGVHARGQVASFRTERAIPLHGIRRGLNSLLPAAIAVRDAAEVARRLPSAVLGDRQALPLHDPRARRSLAALARSRVASPRAARPRRDARGGARR